MNRRTFCKSAALVPAAWATGTRKLKIGHTCITWGTFPRKGEPMLTLEAAMRDIAALGYHSFETFPEVLDDWDSRGQMRPLIDKYKLPFKSGYVTMNLIDPAVRKDGLAELVRRARIVQKFGGTYVVLAPNSVKREGYDFQASRAHIVSALNDYARAVTDLGLGTGLHQHTGTCIETRDEVYAVMEAVDTKHLKFAPDVGQLQKGGADAAKVVKDFLSITNHMHLKDWSGWEHHAGYCPLGMGKVDIKAILDMMEGADPNANIMVELDPARNGPMTPLETAQRSKDYLVKLGCGFRS
jgi:inosose dehydratase